MRTLTLDEIKKHYYFSKFIECEKINDDNNIYVTDIYDFFSLDDTFLYCEYDLISTEVFESLIKAEIMKRFHITNIKFTTSYALDKYNSIIYETVRDYNNYAYLFKSLKYSVFFSTRLNLDIVLNNCIDAVLNIVGLECE